MGKGLKAYVQQSIENDADFKKSSLPEAYSHDPVLREHTTCPEPADRRQGFHSLPRLIRMIAKKQS
ncbi:hypothetical protein J2X69_004682 [Algoriphagus sp. 4150]|nr:hypothetical protein [Algoriphagus sp. 4150]